MIYKEIKKFAEKMLQYISIEDCCKSIIEIKTVNLFLFKNILKLKLNNLCMHKDSKKEKNIKMHK